MPGYVAVVAKQHVVEPFELSADLRHAFWEDVMLVAKALSDLLSPAKMNYELHGNTIPHLHVHVYPRFVDDPFVGGPIDPRQASFVRSHDQLLRIRRAIRDASVRARGTRSSPR
ncbi:MAG TPA: HIT family protein [Thermoplasmata archaeon]